MIKNNDLEYYDSLYNFLIEQKIESTLLNDYVQQEKKIIVQYSQKFKQFIDEIKQNKIKYNKATNILLQIKNTKSKNIFVLQQIVPLYDILDDIQNKNKNLLNLLYKIYFDCNNIMTYIYIDNYLKPSAPIFPNKNIVWMNEWMKFVEGFEKIKIIKNNELYIDSYVKIHIEKFKKFEVYDMVNLKKHISNNYIKLNILDNNIEKSNKIIQNINNNFYDVDRIISGIESVLNEFKDIKNNENNENNDIIYDEYNMDEWTPNTYIENDIWENL
jgi:hypothetical protein